MRPFTLPSGSPMRAAISDRVNPSEQASSGTVHCDSGSLARTPPTVNLFAILPTPCPVWHNYPEKSPPRSPDLQRSPGAVQGKSSASRVAAKAQHLSSPSITERSTTLQVSPGRSPRSGPTASTSVRRDTRSTPAPCWLWDPRAMIDFAVDELLDLSICAVWLERGYIDEKLINS
jgi:hypothetical protein